MRISDWSSDVCSSDLRRLREGGGHEAFAQALFDHMFADMDYNLRELGVGDLSVGQKVKQMAQGFYGRATAYESGLAAGAEAERSEERRVGERGVSTGRARRCAYT